MDQGDTNTAQSDVEMAQNDTELEPLSDNVKTTAKASAII